MTVATKRRPRPSRARTALSRSIDIAAAALGLVGLVVVGWLLFSFFTGATLVVLKTGSMSPTMPAGTAAVTMPTAAADLEVGDVVTVQRDDTSLPVTHRIIEITPGNTPAERELRLQGDANATPDLFPYRVEETHRVITAMPGLGRMLAVAQGPVVMGVATVVVAALCLRAFWPSSSESTTDTRRSRNGD